MSKLKVDEIRSADRSVSSSANITLADNGSTTVPDIIQPNSYWVQGKGGNNVDTAANGEMINMSGTPSDEPYMTWSGSIASFGNGGGSIVSGTSTKDFKFTKKGVYYVGINVQASAESSNIHEFVQIAIRGSGTNSESTTIIQENYGNVPNASNSSNEYDAIPCFFLKAFDANDQINFFINSNNYNSFKFRVETSISIFLIRAIA